MASVPRAVFTCATLGRRALGLGLLLTGLVLITVGVRLEWGVAVTAVLPGLIMLVPAVGLLRQRVVFCDGRQLWIDDRGPIDPTGAEIELVPTAGLRAVLLHPPGSDEVVVATWLFPGRARQLRRWLESQLKRRLPERQWEAHRLDR